MKEFYRSHKSKFGENPASSYNGTIVLYDNAFNSGQDPSLGQILAHELAHEKYKNLSEKDQDSYQMATNWFDFGPDKSHPSWSNRRKDDEFVRPDSKLGPEEDFAVNVQTYLYDSEKLKKRVPHAYTWIKNHFSDNFKLGRSK